jgi:ribosomal protein L18E
MPKFKKKPVVIEAVQFTEGSAEYCLGFIKGSGGEAVTMDLIDRSHPLGATVLRIKTLEGVMTASIGDWIIKGVNGEFYPCKPDIFEKTYEAVKSDSADKAMQDDFESSGSVYPKVEVERIDELMDQVKYDVHVCPGTTTTVVTAMLPMGPINFTLCSEIMACVDPRNFNAELGAKYGIEKAAGIARNKLWELEGYSLAKSMYGA